MRWGEERACFGKGRVESDRLESCLLVAANLSDADLRSANLHWCDLEAAILADAKLAGTNLAKAELGRTVLANLDLSRVRGLRAVRHDRPSTIGTDELERTLAAAAGDAMRLPASERRATRVVGEGGRRHRQHGQDQGQESGLRRIDHRAWQRPSAESRAHVGTGGTAGTGGIGFEASTTINLTSFGECPSCLPA